MDIKLSKLAISSLILAILGILAPIFSLLGLVFGLVALNKIKHSNGLLKGKGTAISGIVLSIIVFILSLFILINYREHYRAFYLPTSSMSPTIKQNERLVVDKKAYVFKSPQRGDIIVFELEYKNKKKLMCKRVIGLPGERLGINKGEIYINGNLIQIPGLPQAAFYLNAGDYGKEGKPAKIPADSYFVLGDTSTNSFDSRYFGFVNKKDIYGKVIFTYVGFPPLSRIVQLLISPAPK